MELQALIGYNKYKVLILFIFLGFVFVVPLAAAAARPPTFCTANRNWVTPRVTQVTTASSSLQTSTPLKNNHSRSIPRKSSITRNSATSSNNLLTLSGQGVCKWYKSVFGSNDYPSLAIIESIVTDNAKTKIYKGFSITDIPDIMGTVDADFPSYISSKTGVVEIDVRDPEFDATKPRDRFELKYERNQSLLIVIDIETNPDEFLDFWLLLGDIDKTEKITTNCGEVVHTSEHPIHASVHKGYYSIHGQVTNHHAIMHFIPNRIYNSKYLKLFVQTGRATQLYVQFVHNDFLYDHHNEVIDATSMSEALERGDRECVTWIDISELPADQVIHDCISIAGGEEYDGLVEVVAEGPGQVVAEGPGDPVPSDPVPSDPGPSDPVPSDPGPSDPVPSGGFSSPVIVAENSPSGTTNFIYSIDLPAAQVQTLNVGDTIEVEMMINNQLQMISVVITSLN